jgi:hypothetical protein
MPMTAMSFQPKIIKSNDSIEDKLNELSKKPYCEGIGDQNVSCLWIPDENENYFKWSNWIGSSSFDMSLHVGCDRFCAGYPKATFVKRMRAIRKLQIASSHNHWNEIYERWMTNSGLIMILR